jgi:diacylglycerol kinase
VRSRRSRTPSIPRATRGSVLAKDLAAGAVLVAAIAAAVIGALLFGPRLLARLYA